MLNKTDASFKHRNPFQFNLMSVLVFVLSCSECPAGSSSIQEALIYTKLSSVMFSAQRHLLIFQNIFNLFYK